MSMSQPFYILLLFFFSISACSQPAKEKTVIMEKELTTVYSRQDTIINVKRSVLNNDKSYSILSYEITMQMPEVIEQRFVKKEDFNDQNDYEKAKARLTSYNWQPAKDANVLFVQIAGSAFKNEIDALEKRGIIEQKIDTFLKSKKQGEWFAGDIGPRGANMLFMVTGINDAMKSIIEVLKNEKLDAKTAVARRIMMEDGNWFYEVLYPDNYSGYFITQ